MSNWNGFLFVLTDELGQDYVSITMPTAILEAKQVRAFKANGPYMPLGFPEQKLVGNAEKWMDGLGKGFSFNPCRI